MTIFAWALVPYSILATLIAASFVIRAEYMQSGVIGAFLAAMISLAVSVWVFTASIVIASVASVFWS